VLIGNVFSLFFSSKEYLISVVCDVYSGLSRAVEISKNKCLDPVFFHLAIIAISAAFLCFVDILYLKLNVVAWPIYHISVLFSNSLVLFFLL